MAGIGYELKITGGKEEISLTTEGSGNQNIEKVYFRKKTLPSANNRANSMHCEFEIVGELNKGTKQALKLMAEWALDVNKDTLYRTVNISVVEDDEEKTTDKVFRNYSFSNMYVIDYEEGFDKSEDDEGKFRLLVGQKSEKSTQDIQV